LLHLAPVLAGLPAHETILAAPLDAKPGLIAASN